MTEKQRIAHQRRNFIKGVAAAGGAVALTLAARNATAASSDDRSKAEGDAESKGYRRTPHVDAFYASTRI
ncbi:MAG: twin-arginine translocation signal domain-containing protein [Gammaproteobacteria bacterium]|nr:twin-arginine translocation signal domain-containing protein [Gammaproteobacteria bacterium]